MSNNKNMTFDYDNLKLKTCAELRKLCKNYGITRYSALKKHELCNHIIDKMSSNKQNNKPNKKQNKKPNKKPKKKQNKKPKKKRKILRNAEQTSIEDIPKNLKLKDKNTKISGKKEIIRNAEQTSIEDIPKNLKLKDKNTKKVEKTSDKNEKMYTKKSLNKLRVKEIRQIAEYMGMDVGKNVKKNIISMILGEKVVTKKQKEISFLMDDLNTAEKLKKFRVKDLKQIIEHHNIMKNGNLKKDLIQVILNYWVTPVSVTNINDNEEDDEEEEKTAVSVTCINNSIFIHTGEDEKEQENKEVEIQIPQIKTSGNITSINANNDKIVDDINNFNFEEKNDDEKNELLDEPMPIYDPNEPEIEFGIEIEEFGHEESYKWLTDQIKNMENEEKKPINEDDINLDWLNNSINLCEDDDNDISEYYNDNEPFDELDDKILE